MREISKKQSLKASTAQSIHYILSIRDKVRPLVAAHIMYLVDKDHFLFVLRRKSNLEYKKIDGTLDTDIINANSFYYKGTNQNIVLFGLTSSGYLEGVSAEVLLNNGLDMVYGELSKRQTELLDQYAKLDELSLFQLVHEDYAFKYPDPETNIINPMSWLNSMTQEEQINAIDYMKEDHGFNI